MPNSYFIKRGEKVHGPFSESQLRTGLKSNKLSSQDLVSRTRTGPWREINSEFAANQQTSSPKLEEDILGWINDGTGCADMENFKQDSRNHQNAQIYESPNLHPPPEKKQQKLETPMKRQAEEAPQKPIRKADNELVWERTGIFKQSPLRKGIHLRCPHCNSHLGFDKRAYSKELPCPACNRLIFFVKPNMEAIAMQIFFMLVTFVIIILLMFTDFFETIFRNKTRL